MTEGQIMTAEEINNTFDSEWVLLDDPEANEFNEVLRGRVVYHSKDRDEVYRQIRKLTSRRFAVLYTGRSADDDVFVL
jgi:hypothetical protein